MISLNNMKTSVRLGLGFGLIILLLVVVMATSLNRLSVLGNNIEAFAVSRVPKLILSGRVVENILQSARQMRNVLILDHEGEIKSEIADVTRNELQIKESIEQIEKLLSDVTEKNIFKDMIAARTAYLPVEAEFVALATKGDFGTAKDVMLERVRPAQLKLVGVVNAFIEYESVNSESDAKAAQASQSQAQKILIVLMLIAVAVAALAAVWITRALTQSLGGEPAYAAEIVNRIAQGDLTVEVQTRNADQSSLLAAMKAMTEKLSKVVHDIRGSAESIRTAAEEVAAGNSDLSQRSEIQASTLEETASSMEELTTAVRENTQGADKANALAKEANQVATQGGAAVGAVVTTMNEIQESSRKIGDIISVIDSIAFQTNILALNAAVEAARAGEQGRGFAVVASEVRALAQRSAQAAKEVKTLIGNSVQKVEIGTRQVEDAGKAMSAIVTSVEKVTAIIDQITVASREQASGIEQVNKAVGQMDQVVQQNAAVVEQAAAAAESMQANAQQLVESVSVFKLSGVAYAQPAAREPARHPPPTAHVAVRTTAKLAQTRTDRALPEARDDAGNEAWKEF
ncbi:MAG TPA: methyl-accepting chemotaxis protein [Burkholderiales bacterium]|nr:methyl-accepting chemotaxis protein [Burkholderiales bacterium]